MRKWIWNSKFKSSGAMVLAAVVALATMSPGGAFTASAAGNASVGSGTGFSFEAFALALADDVIQEVTGIVAAGGSAEQARQAADTHVRAEVSSLIGSLGLDVGTDQASADASFDSQAAMQAAQDQVDQFVDSFDEVDLGQAPSANLDDNAADAQAQVDELENASSEEVIAALLALLDGVEPEVFGAIDTAEAAVLAMIDQARAQAVAGFAQIDVPELEAFALAQIDMARVMVQQAFDQVRLQVEAAFAEARNRIIEELTGVDFGEALDEVLAEIAAIEDLVHNKLAEVQELLQNLGGGVIG